MIFVHRKIALYLARVWRLFANFTRLFEKETFAYHRTSLLNKKLCITLRLFAMFCVISRKLCDLRKIEFRYENEPDGLSK